MYPTDWVRYADGALYASFRRSINTYRKYAFIRHERGDHSRCYHR